jgi:UDP-glucose 4-epimerase
MRSHGIRKIAFTPTGSVYGKATVIPTPDDAPFPIQTSLYAASKLAGERLITAYCEGLGFQSWIFALFQFWENAIFTDMFLISIKN